MVCSICKHSYFYDYSVTDEDWETVTGIKNGSGLICLDCFDAKAYTKKYKYKILFLVYPEWFKWKK